MKSLKWRQVNAWRLAQHGLSPRLKPQELVEAARRTGGVQAQVMSAADLALRARVDGLAPGGVQSALWQARTLVKTWAMRATLHLLAAADLPLYVAARSLSAERSWIKYFAYYGVSEEGYAAYLAAAPQILGREPLTREQFAAALAEHTGSPELRSLILDRSWGTPLKPLAWRGHLCFGPNQGRSVTFVHPGKWLGGWQPVEPYPALQEIARRYLHAYGPANPQDFALWWEGGTGILAARKLFQSIEAELEPVDVEGWRAFALSTALDPMQRAEPPGAVRLLPLFDAYVLGLPRGRALRPILPEAYLRQVYRPQGWISAVVLVDGYMRGVWETQARGAQTLIKVRLFDSPSLALRKGLEAEAARLGAFWNTEVALAYEELS